MSRPSIVLAAAFMLMLVVSSSSSRIRSADTWVIRIDDSNFNDLQNVSDIAAEHNFEIVNKIDLEDSGYYVVKSSHHRLKRSLDKNQSLTDLINQSESKLQSHPLVSSFHREQVLKRTKRDFVPNFNTDLNLQRQRNLQLTSRYAQVKKFFGKNLQEDPEWRDMWYLNRHLYNPDLPDMNVTGAWAQGYSGRGVSVTFLDDGLEYTHPDLKQNYDPKASYDINSNDADPIPRYDSTNENKHGTRCAGEVAAAANNSICSVGVAYHAGIGGIRMLDGDVTDSVEARSLVFARDHINIYSASWGPDDNGQVVDGPGALAKQAFSEGVKIGRKGLGSIFVWASGNGGRFDDSCACDGYANSIYTLSISSTSENSEKPWYLEECTSTLATTYSSGDQRHGEREIATTDLRHKCTTRHTGTSAAAPIAAGIVALALEANPSLTWRDLMYLTVLSSRPNAIKTNNYIKNHRGFMVSSRYGFGLMDAGRMTELAKDWTNVPPMHTCKTDANKFKIVKKHGNKIDASIMTNACFQSPTTEVNYIEQVEIVVTINADIRGSVEVYLTSPMGTSSLILPRRSRDKSRDGFKNWHFMTVQLWGESPRGEWKLHVESIDGSHIELLNYGLIIHGTQSKPAEYDKQMPAMKKVTCHYECKQSGVSCGPTEFDCTACAHYSFEYEPNNIKCVSYCPKGYYADDASAKCVKCHSDCKSCQGPSKSDCISCHRPKIFNPKQNTCVTECPDRFFTNLNEECEACAGNCLTCKYTANSCTACKSDAQSKMLLRNHTCIEENACDQGMFFDPAKNKCSFCDITCRSCSNWSQNSCIDCLEKRPFLNEGQCVANCAEGFYSIGNYCFKCSSHCSKCTGTGYTCSVCKPGYKLSEDKRCEIDVSDECNDNCYECNGKDLCITCKNGYVSLNGQCVNEVPVGFYKRKEKTNSGIRLTIAKCKASCSKCTDHDVCQACTDGTQLINQNCLPICKPNFFAALNGTCAACSPECDGCLNETTCLGCNGIMKLYEGKCIDKCPSKFYPDSKRKCKECYPSCHTCNGPDKTNCLTCNAGFKYSPIKNECISECPDGTFYDLKSKVCQLCDSNTCAQCIRSAEMCTKCQTPYALDEGAFKCRPCCVRSVGSVLNGADCCKCAVKNTGVCSSNVEQSLINFKSLLVFGGKHNTNEAANKFIIFISVVFILLAAGFSMFATLSCFRMFLGKAKSVAKYGRVEYSPLNENLEIT